MASRHEIISIDFRANAAKANPAMDALRESAKNMRTEVEKTKTAISDGIKTGKSQEELDKLGAKLRTQERELKSFETAMNTLAKGVTTLSRAIDAFNTGTLDQMSAAFQKASYNAAETAKKALLPGTKDYQKNMAELDALQQKNLENLAKYKLRTEQMLQSIGKEGSKISSQDLKQEADGIQELMRLLPHMSHEWLEYNDILKQVNAAIKQQTDDEKRLTGAIVDANDARERSSQLTRKGVEEATRQRKEAEEEVKQRTENIAALKEERAEKAKHVSIDAANAIAKDKEVEKQRKVVAAIQERIDNEKKDAERKQKNIDKLNQEATAYENNAKIFREAAETMKGEVKGIDDELKHVNEELVKMGTSAGPDAAGASADKVSAAKEKEAQSTDKSTEAAKKEQQASKDSAAAKKEETKATEENAAAKEKEVKAGETAAKAAENEKVTVESLIKRNDELKIKISALNEERKQMLATQEKNAAAVKEEANAYKDLSKEQAQAMLDQKQQLATFKKEGEKWQIGNREEAQRYLFDALGEINPANVGKTTMSIESSPEKISQLLGKFQERYGIEGEGEAMAAVRELMSGGGLVKSGFMNKFFMNVEENVPKVAAYSKEIKDLAAVINGEVKSVEEDTEKKRTLADVEAELEAAEKESRDISIQAMKMRNGQADATEGLTQKTVKLTDAQKERIATIKAETEAVRQMSQEEAKAALAEVKKVSTVGYKAGKLHMSDPEEVQQFLIGKMRTIGKVKNDNGTLSLAGGQVDALVSAFQQRYGWKDDKTNAKALLKKILQGKDGMFMGGDVDLSADVGSVRIQYVKDIYDARIEKAKALVDVSKGVKQATDEVSDATRRGADAAKDATEATKGQTDAIKQQEAEVVRRKAAFDKMNEEYEQADKKLKDMRQRYASLPSSGTDAALAKAQLKDEIDDYNENVVKKARADKNRLKKLWEKSVSDLTKMMGISTEETQKSTAAQNQETEAIEKGAKSRGRKKKAVEGTTQAVREEAKAEGDAAKQGEQLSEQDRKRIALEQKKQELETKRGQKIDEITKKEDAAAAAEVRANNNRSEARQMTEELSQAHGKNADALDKESEKLKKSEFEQGKLNDKVNEGRKALAEYDQKIDDNAEKRLEAQKKQAQAQRLTIDTMTEAIKVLEARNRAIEPESEEWVKNARLIRQYQAELDRLKQQPVLQLMTERMGSIRTLSADALQETKRFWQTMAAGAERGSHQLEVYEGNLRVITEEERQRQQQIQQPMRQRLNNLGNLSTADLAETKRYWETVRDGVSQTSAAYKKAELAVKALTNEENRRKANAQAQYINEQMRDLNNLSTAGLTEVKRYWQAMADGAKRGSDEAKDAEAALKRINDIESERRRAADKQQVRTLFGDLSKKNGEDIRAAIEAGRRLIDTYDSGGPAAKRLSQAILDAEEHLKQYGIEAERSARREAQALEEAAQRRKEQDQLMRQQLDQGTSLSESALKTQQQYWQRLIDDPKTAKESLAGYRYELERTIALQEQQASVTREERAARLNGNLGDYSTAEIREAIEAAKQLAASYKSGSTEATELTKKIVAAEEHINKYGLETERAAQKQREQIELMEEQLRRGTGLTETALKQQESYWRRLADDPKAAADEIARYFENLNKVHAIQKEQAESQTTAYGLNALNFFRGDTSNASADQIKEQAKALKAYRDSLPSKDRADVIAEIDGYLKAAGVSAKGAADDVMDLKTALDLAEKAGQWNKGDFAYSPQEIQAATKALELRREELIKQIRAERDLGNAVDAQEKELDDLTKKLRSLKFEQDNVNMSQEKMRTLIETPANAVNLDELRAAIKRADGQLRQMEQSLGQNSDEYKRFAEQVRQAKNVMKEMEGQSKASATAWEKAFSRLKTYVVMYMGFNEVWQKVTGTARDLMDLSDRMGEVRKTTGFTADEVGRLSENLKKMDVRTSLVSLLEISSSAGQLGLKTLEDVQGFTEAANKLMIALPEMGREAATEMMRVAIATGEVDKIRKQLQEGTVEGSSATAVAMEKIASTIDRLRATSASTAPEITDFVKRVGAVGAQSGITIDQVAALGSTVSSLGMRIEMSATALSRMIPAIRNNAFELAKAIGVTPDTIRNLFDTGRGMEVILMILQRIKDTGMDADSVEQMLGMAGMRDIMKDLNQQGARAGIVFSGLSQNVDELRRQLGVANEAYEENIAIQQEFDKMNETTAAKWERLKNALEEGFVGDKPQRLLGGIIDGLRKIVDFMVGDSSISSAFRTILVYIGLVRMQLISLAAGALTSVGGGLRNIGIMLGFIKGEMTKLQWGNIFTALAGAVLYAYMAFKDLKSAAEKAQESLGKTKDDVARAQEQFEGYWRKLKDTSTALEQARKSHDQLSAEVDKLRNSTDKGAAATENLRKKEDELKKSEDSVTKASNDHKTAISQMNSIYGKYLGFILTETNYANLAAAAHNKVAAAIEREMLMKQKQAAISEVDSNYSADIASNYGKLSERLTQQGLNRSQASQAMADLQKFLRENVSYDAVNNQTVVSKAVTDQLKKSGLNLSKATSNEIVALWYDKYLKDTYHLSDKARMNITGVNRTADRDEGWQNVYSPFATNVRGGYADTYVQRERERGSVSAVYNADLTRVEGEEAKAAGTLLQRLEKQAKDSKAKILDKSTSDKDRNDAYINLANALEGLDNRINELDPKRDAETINRLRDMAKSLSGEGISIKKLTAARREIHSTLFDRATFDENAIREAGNANPWGTSEPGESTNWKEMTAEQLVNRRKQMNEFVNSIQTDTDVKAVLNEDKALKKAIEAGMSSDMRTVIEWYNTERLKIQDELHARHLTNTGDWLDPKKERGAKKQFRDEMDAYLHELDAYYTERKTRIEEAGTDEGLTEAEIRNRTLANEMEWQQRRAELQKLYSRKQKEVTQEELEAIYHIISERTGDTESFVKAQIAKTNQFVDAIEKSGDRGAAIVHRWMSQVELDTERSYLKGQQALTKQMKAIQDIIDRERPFNGITKQLRESLSTMDILTGDMRKEYDELMKAGKDMRDFNERQGRAELQRTTFLLGEAEQAYSTTIDRVMQQMREKGMSAWADWLSIRPEQQEALMAQLRQTYDGIQDAIKKEASQLKKQAEIMWNNILVPGDGKTTMKQMLDRTVAQLGIDQGRVSRANSLIGAGVASERVADKLAIQQMRLQLTMQEHYYNLMKKQGRAHVDMLNQQADAAERRGNAEEATRKRLDAQHAEMALNLATAKEETELAKQREEIIARTEESQNRLYTELRSWADLLTSSLQGVFEASHAGDAEYYNEMAKLNLTGKGGPGAGTYMVIDDAGTSDAKAHYEYLDERQALERQHEIEVQNAQAEAWRKLMDDLNMKMSETITDQLNALLQNSVIDANTQAVIKNTEALYASMGAAGDSGSGDGYKRNAEGFAVDEQGQIIAPVQPTGETPSGEGMPKAPWQMTDEEVAKSQENMGLLWQTYKDQAIAAETEKAEMLTELPGYVPSPLSITDEQIEATGEKLDALKQKEIDASIETAQAKMQAQEMVKKSEQQNDQQMVKTNKSSFAAMTAAANMYGIAYQTMSNDNLDTSQKVQMMIVQAAGQAAISMLTASMAASTGETAANAPSWISKTLKELGPIGGPVAVGVFTALIGGLMGLATSKIAKSKSEIAQVTGASVGAGRLATGMLTYAEGNVNELTDPASLTPGRQYNVDGADGKTYRARYMGKGAKTHITNGPEFHLVGEAGREAIIDAKTTRLLQLNETGIWRDIQTLYNGGSISGLSTRRRRGTGVRAFADGNIGEFEEMTDGGGLTADGMGGFGAEQMAAFQTSLDRNNELLERALTNGIKGVFGVYGPDGIVNAYDTGKKKLQRHGVDY